MKHKVKRVHFVGIGGSGMSGIAEVLLNLGYQVSGSDLSENCGHRAPARPGCAHLRGHDPAQVQDADAVVVSTAVKPDNPEVSLARAKRIPVVPRALMLAELMRLKQGIAIAGTHGKTTTTSLIASVLAEAGMDPTFVIGGRLEAAGTHARLGRGEFIVVEADESDASFLHLQPVLAVVTNIDADHMETYGHDFGRLRQAFVDFVQRLPFYGMAVLCVDDANVRAIIPLVTKPITTYGVSDQAQIRAIDIRHEGGRMRFTAQLRSNGGPAKALDLVVNLPGVHNVQNALAAVAVGLEVQAPEQAIARALAEFEGVGRRFQRYGEIPLASGGDLRLDRRLWAPPGGDGGYLRGGAGRVPRAAPRARLSAAPLYAHARLLRGLRARAVQRRCSAARGGLSPPASLPSWPPTGARWRARCVWPERSNRSSSSRSRTCPTRYSTRHATVTSW